MLASFTAAARHMDAALAAIPLDALPAARDTVDDIGQLRAALDKAVFALPQEHTAALKVFRAACDEVRGHASALEEKVKDVLQTVRGWGPRVDELLWGLQGAPGRGTPPWHAPPVGSGLRRSTCRRPLARQRVSHTPRLVVSAT